MTDNGVAGVIVNESKNCKYDCELRNTDAGAAESVNNCPGVTEPGDFGKNETTYESSEGKISIFTL